MGVTAYWIKSMANPTEWKLCNEVIAFKGIVGTHTGENLRQYFVGLCKQVGIIINKDCKISSYIFVHLFPCTLTLITFLCNC